MNKVKNTIGSRIKKCRMKLGMKQVELAEKMCITPTQLCKYETDQVDIRRSILIEIAGHLETTPGYLIDGSVTELDEDTQLLVTAFNEIDNDAVREAVLFQAKSFTDYNADE